MTLKIRIPDITDKEKILEAEEAVDAYPALLGVQKSGECVFLSPLNIQLKVVREYDHIRVAGGVDTVVGLSCSRCTNRFTTDLSSDFTIFFTKASGLPLDDEVELTDQDLVAVTYDGEEIDFTEQIAEQVLLELPLKPLCRETCRGLCPNCGADLNSNMCSCQEEKASLTFSALKDFKAKQ